MLLNGLFSVLQITFLPGFILLLLLRFNQGVIRNLVLSLGLSLIFNFLLVLLLVALGFYSKQVVLLVFTVEAILFLLLLLSRPLIFNHAKTPFLNVFNDQPAYMHWLFVLTIFFSVGIIWYAYFKAGVVLSVPDPSASYGLWASQWYQHHAIPAYTFYYPQLMPANWSLSYQMLGTDLIQLFIKMTVPLYALAILACFYDLFFRTRRWVYLFSVLFCSIFFLASAYTGYPDTLFAGAGTADMPATFFTMLAIYVTLLCFHESHRRTVIAYYLLGMLFSVGATLSKQTGWYIAVIYPFLFYGLVLRQRSDIKNRLAWLLLGIVITIGLSSIWYLYQYVHMSHMNIKPMLSETVGQFYRGSSGELIHRVGRAFYQVFNGSVGLFVVFLLFGIWGAIVSRLARVMFCALFLPVFLLWTYTLGYDARALMPVVPVLSLSAAFGLQSLLAYCSQKACPIRGKYIALLLLAFFMAWFVLKIDKKAFINHQIRAQFRTQLVENGFLYRYIEKHQLKGKVLTNYFYMATLPKLRNYFIGGKLYDINPTFSRDYIKDQLQAHPDICYIFVSKNFFVHDLSNQLNKPIKDWMPYLNERILNNPLIRGRVDIIKKGPNFLFLEFKRCQS